MVEGKEQAPTLTCPRHRVETPLTCVTCGTPICPRCYVRTAVGLRCPKCAEGVTVKLRRGPRWGVIVPAVVAVVAVGLVVALALGSDGGGEQADEDVTAVEDQGDAAPGYRLVSRPELGYAVEVPVRWLPAPDDSPTTLSYAEPRPSEGSLRITVSEQDAPLGEIVDGLVAELHDQNAQDVSRTPVQVSGLPGVRLTYRLPTSETPGAAPASHTSYLVKRGSTLYTLQLATTDPGAKESVFAYIASTFRLL